LIVLIKERSPLFLDFKNFDCFSNILNIFAHDEFKKQKSPSSPV